MMAKRVAGMKNLPLAASFSKRFIQDQPLPLRVSVVDFDAWCSKNGLNDLKRDRDTILKRRNLAKRVINISACSEVWGMQGKPFHIAVRKIGIDYQVSEIDDAFDKLAHRVPHQVNSLMNTKRRALQSLLNGTDLEKLPLDVRLYLSNVNDEIGALGKRIEMEVALIDQKFKRLQSNIAKLLPPSADVTKFLEVDGDGQDDDLPDADESADLA